MRTINGLSIQEYIKYNLNDYVLIDSIHADLDEITEEVTQQHKTIERLEEQNYFATFTIEAITEALAKSGNSKLKKDLLAILSDSSFEL